jgi:thymidylate kinase
MLLSKPFMVEFSGTPEAGKTTTINTVANMLRSKNYNVMTLKESAESLPKEIEKGTFEANLWMHFMTQAGILRAINSNADVVLIDRGTLDSDFYGQKFLAEGECTTVQYNEFKRTFLECLKPNLFIALMVSPEVSVKRRGGEGRLVNTEYIKNYNSHFLTFFQKLDLEEKELMVTDNLDVYRMNEVILKIILKHLL